MGNCCVDGNSIDCVIDGVGLLNLSCVDESIGYTSTQSLTDFHADSFEAAGNWFL